MLVELPHIMVIGNISSTSKPETSTASVLYAEQYSTVHFESQLLIFLTFLLSYSSNVTSDGGIAHKPGLLF